MRAIAFSAVILAGAAVALLIVHLREGESWGMADLFTLVALTVAAMVVVARITRLTWPFQPFKSRPANVYAPTPMPPGPPAVASAPAKYCVAACPEALGDGKQWTFYFLNGTDAAVDVLVKLVGHEWGGTGRKQLPAKTVAAIAPGSNAPIWRDNDDEVRMWMELRVTTGDRHADLSVEFPLLYRRIDKLEDVPGLGKRGWVAAAV